jgi:hypothetical protein
MKVSTKSGQVQRASALRASWRRSTRTLGDMNKRLCVALAAYVALWMAVAGAVIYSVVRAGYSAWIAVACAYLLFLFVNGSLAYRARARQFRIEGEEPPPYFQYLFFPDGVPKLRDFKEEAPKSTHLLVGIAVALTGVFFLLCGVALAFDADWSRISQPLLAAAICIVLGSIGAAFLYLAWRLLSFGRRLPPNVA